MSFLGTVAYDQPNLSERGENKTIKNTLNDGN